MDTTELWANAISALFASIAGAVGGAYAAQRIAENGKERDELLKEIRTTNLAIEVASALIRAYLNLKTQYVRGVKERFDEGRAAVAEHYEKVKSGAIPVDTELDLGRVEFVVLNPVPLPVERLEKVVLEQLSITGRANSLALVLVQTSIALNASMAARNELMVRDRDPKIPEPVRVALIFGIEYKPGTIDATFGNLVDAIASGTDDCIHFTWLLYQDLFSYGTAFRKRFASRFRGTPPRIVTLDISGAQAEGLFPDPKNYTDWEKGFWKRVPPTGGRRLQKIRLGMRRRTRRVRNAFKRR